MSTESSPEQVPEVVSVDLAGGILSAAQNLVASLCEVRDVDEAVFRAVSILDQARGRQIVLIDPNGDEVELQGVWRD